VATVIDAYLTGVMAPMFVILALVAGWNLIQRVVGES
jgi:hypothetical protein